MRSFFNIARQIFAQLIFCGTLRALVLNGFFDDIFDHLKACWFRDDFVHLVAPCFFDVFFFSVTRTSYNLWLKQRMLLYKRPN